MDQKQRQVIRLERGGQDRLIPRDFFDILMNRFLPVLSLTYVSIVLAIAAEKKDVIRYLLQDNTAYVMGLFVVLWVSGPGLIWIFLRANPMLSHVADIWYKILAVIMVLTIMISFLLFPEAGIYGLRIYFVSAIPIFVVMYFFFVKGGLPAIASYPLNLIGLGMLLWGALINVF